MMIIPAGTDYLTISGSPAARYDFGGDIGVVNLRMRPVGPGNTNTIRRRLEHAHLPTPGSSDTIPMEIVLISTESEEPFLIQGKYFNLFLRTTPGKQSIGKMTITRSADRDEQKDGIGGTFTSCVLCHFIADFISVDGNSGNFSVASSIVLETQQPGSWSSIPEPRTILLHGEHTSQLANFHRNGPEGICDFFIAGTIYDGLPLKGGHVASAAQFFGDPINRDFDAETLQPLRLMK